MSNEYLQRAQQNIIKNVFYDELLWSFSNEVQLICDIVSISIILYHINQYYIFYAIL